MARAVKQKEINFLAVLVGRGSKSKIKPRAFIAPGVLLLLVIIGVATFGFLHSSAISVQVEANTIKEYLDSPDTNRQLSEAENLQAQARAMESRAQNAAAPMDNLATYPDLTSGNYAQILAFAGANIELSSLHFERSTGILSFTATSDYVLSIPTFISQMRNSGMFNDITYSGYAGNAAVSQIATTTSRTTGASGSASGITGSSSTSSTAAIQTPLYAFNVECSVKPPAASTPEDGQTTEAEGN